MDLEGTFLDFDGDFLHSFPKCEEGMASLAPRFLRPWTRQKETLTLVYCIDFIFRETFQRIEGSCHFSFPAGMKGTLCPIKISSTMYIFPRCLWSLLDYVVPTHELIIIMLQTA